MRTVLFSALVFIPVCATFRVDPKSLAEKKEIVVEERARQRESTKKRPRKSKRDVDRALGEAKLAPAATQSSGEPADCHCCVTVPTKAPNIPGDFSGDDSVDTGDYLVWRKLENTYVEPYSSADADGNGLVDRSDYNTMMTNFGTKISNVVLLNPTDNVRSVVASKAPGTVFRFRSGLYRLTAAIVPKSRQTFLAEPNVILSGSKVLTFSRSGSVWMAVGQTQGGTTHGSCAVGSPRCNYPEDVFFDDVPLRHVASLAEVLPGTWYFDYAGDRIYIGNNPAGHLVETSWVRNAFSDDNTVDDVKIRKLVIEKFACFAQNGAIRTNGARWILEDCEIRLNHGQGVHIKGSGSIVRRNYIHDNGQMGVASVDSVGVTFEQNEIARNNYAGYNIGWEAGGSKFVQTTNLSLIANYAHHNHGGGLWTDTDNIHTLIELNHCFDNDNEGIFHEISYDVVIRNNVVSRNAEEEGVPWLYGGQIVISTSSNANVHNNKVEVSPVGGNGITIIQQNRGSGLYGPRVSKNNYVHHNTVTVLPGRVGLPAAQSGGAADWKRAEFFASSDNRFNFNTYHVPSLTANHWAWNDSWRNWSSFRGLGQEAQGSADTNVRPDETARCVPVIP